MQNLTILIPAYNEEKRLGPTLHEYCTHYEQQKDYNTTILVVINNTKDKTEGIVKTYQKKHKNLRYINLKQGGKGNAILLGMEHALKHFQPDLVGFADADMATRPDAFHELVTNIKDADAIIANRAHPQSTLHNTKLSRKISSAGFSTITRLLLHLPYADTQCGAKLFTKKTVNTILESNITTKWSFDVDILYNLKHKHHTVKSIPTTWEDKDGTTLEATASIKMFAALVRLRLLHSPFKFLVRAYDTFLPEKIKFHSL